MMGRDPDLEIRAEDIKQVQRRVEEHGKPELGDPDLIAADDSGASAMAQKLTFKPDEAS